MAQEYILREKVDCPKVSIIAINWNGLSDTIECINSVLCNDYPNYNIIVLDNGSDDSEANVLSEKFGSSIEVISLDKNIGSPAGMNLLINYVNKKYLSDYILYLDNDTIVSKSFLSNMVDVVKKDPKIALVGGKFYYYDDPTRIQFTWRDIDLITNEFIAVLVMIRDTFLKIKVTDKGIHDIERDADTVGFWCVLMNRDIINKVGLFDNRFFFGFGEVDLCIRLKKAKYRVVYCPKAMVWHKYRFIKKNPEMLAYYGRRGRFWLIRKHGNILEKILFFLYFFLVHFWLVTVYYLFILRKPKIFISFCKGIYDGIFE